MHIKQLGNGVNTFVKNATGDLTRHPAIIEHPERFEVVKGNPPEDAHELIYSSETSPATDTN